jgi:ribosome maturation factor RimP
MEERIRTCIEEVVAEVAMQHVPEIYLVDIAIKRVGRGKKIEVLVDTDRGISISQCASLSRKIRERLEGDEVLSPALGGDFELLVSSPGIGEPVRKHRQYIRHIGRLLKVVHVNEEGVQVETVGRLVQAVVADEQEPFIVIEPQKAGKSRKTLQTGSLTLRLADIVRASVQVEL